MPHCGGGEREKGERKFGTDRSSLPGNIVIVAIIAAGGYAYMRYSQGRPIAPTAQKKVQ